MQHQTGDPLSGDCLAASQLRPAAEVSPASVRHLQTRGEVVPCGDNPRDVLPMRCQMGKRRQATLIIFGRALLSYSASERVLLQCFTL